MRDAELKRDLVHGTFMEVHRAVDRLAKHVHNDDLPLLFEAYESQHSWDIRTDILDLIGSVATQASCEFLTSVARSRTHYLVRYYAMLNLIELDCAEWRPILASKLKTDYYASLSVYEDFVRGRIDVEELHEIARTRSIKNGDHWEWLTHLEQSGRRS